MHAAIISVKDGGRVVIKVQKGLESYAAGSANGVDARDWPDWPGSFVVVAR